MICVVLCAIVSLVVSAPRALGTSPSYSGQASIGKSGVKTSSGASGGQASAGAGTNTQTSSGKGSSGQGSGGQASGGKGTVGKGTVSGMPVLPAKAPRQGDSNAKSSNRVAITGSDNKVEAENVNSLDSIFWYGRR